MSKDYSNFVNHPRYGQAPRITGLNPKNSYLTGKVFLHWHSPNKFRIPNTAIMANTDKQVDSTIPVTHYFDVQRKCKDCNKNFIFFAEEQKYWYEELQFPLESDCIRCINCRKNHQHINVKRKYYESLIHIERRTLNENLELAECAIYLSEENIFGKKQLNKIRIILKEISKDHDVEYLLKRINKLEAEIS